MDNFVSNTISVLDGDSLMTVPSSMLNQHIFQVDENGQHVLVKQPVQLVDNASYENDAIQSYQLVENESMEGATCYIASETGEQLYEIPFTEQIQQLLMSGNEMILVQEVPGNNLVEGQQHTVNIQDPSIISIQEPLSWDINQMDDNNGTISYGISDNNLLLVTGMDTIDIPDDFKCEVCGVQEKSFRKLQLHLKTHEQDMPHKCLKCSAAFNHEVNLKIHFVTNHQEESGTLRYKCPVCTKVFNRAASFKGHMKLHLVDEDFICSICSETFKTKNLFDIHVNNHKNGSLITKKRPASAMHCKVCGTPVFSLGLLKRHYAQAHPKSKHNAQKSDVQVPIPVETMSVNNTTDRLPSSRASKVKAAQYLNQVLTKRTEIDEVIDREKKPKKKSWNSRPKQGGQVTDAGFQCHCGKTFNKRSLFTRHSIIHTSERPFQCTICKKAFNQKSALKTHMKSHSQDRPYNCTTCNRRFSHKCNYRHHIMVGHRSDKSCPGCSALFNRRVDLMKHMNVCSYASEFISMVNNFSEPPISSESVLRRCLEEDLTNNDLTTTYSYMYQSAPETHLASPSQDISIQKDKITIAKDRNKLTVEPNHSQNILHCGFCQRQYTRLVDFARHMRLHIKKKPFRCRTCQRRFNIQSVFYKHIKQHHKTDKFVCNTCSKSFSTPHLLHNHNVSHTFNDNFHCKLCDSMFTTLTQYKFHNRLHKLKFRQNHSKKFATNNKFENLEAIHWDELNHFLSPKMETSDRKKMSCSMCLNKFNSLLIFKDHLRYHIRKNSFTNTKSEQKETRQIALPVEKAKTDLIDFDQQNKNTQQIKVAEAKSYWKPPQNQMSNANYACKFCEKVFLKPSLLRRHIVIHTKERAYKCSFCHKCFNQKSSLKTHMIFHSNEKPYKCETCNRKFGVKCNYAQHMKNGRCLRNMCPKCHTFFPKISDLTCHMNVCPGKQVVDSTKNMQVSVDSNVTNLFPSGVPVEFLNNSVMKSVEPPSKLTEIEVADRDTGTIQIHNLLQDVNGRRIFQCSICQKQYKKTVDLMRHMRIHTNEKPFRCALCRKCFRLKSVYHTHLRSHKKSKEFACSFCSKSFAMLQTMRIHMRLHTGTYSYPCDKCDRRFTTSSHCYYHMRTHSKREAKAQIKNQKFENTKETSSDQLEPLQWDELSRSLVPIKPPRNRIIKTTKFLPERPHRCTVCNRVYKSKSHLNFHMRQHTEKASPHVCKYCHKHFTSKSSLISHMKTLHLKTDIFQCAMCHSVFPSASSIKRHMVVHSTGLPYVCPVCNKSFKTKMYCQNHIKLHVRDGSDKIVHVHPKDTVPNQDQFQLTDIGMSENSSLGNVFTTLLVANPICDQTKSSTSVNTELIECNVTDLTSYAALAGENADAFLSIDASDGNPLQTFHVQNTADNYLNSLQNASTSIDTTNLFNPTESFFPIQNDPSYNNHTINESVGPMMQLVHTDQYPYESNVSVSLMSNTSSVNCPLLTQALFSEDDTNQQYRQEQAQSYVQKDTFSSTICPSSSVGGTSGICASLNFTPETSQSIKEKPLYGCKKCDHIFMKSENLVNHVKMAHSIGKSHQCPECKRYFVTLLSLKAHAMSHTRTDPNDKSPYNCLICSASFDKQRSLSSHVITSHSSELNVYRCVHCQKDYRTIRELENHIRRIILESESLSQTSVQLDGAVKNSVVTVLDSKQTDQIARLKPNPQMSLSERYLIETAKEKHSGVFTEQRKLQTSRKSSKYSSYQCKECLKCFIRPSDLQRHSRTHTKERPFSCLQCTSSFTSKASLNLHIDTLHSDKVKIYQCHLCNKTYSNAYSLKNHMRIHTSSKKYNCEKCSATFTTYNARAKHIKNFHKDLDCISKPEVAHNNIIKSVGTSVEPVENETSQKFDSSLMLESSEAPIETLEFQILFTPNELAAVGGQQTVTVTHDTDEIELINETIDDTTNQMILQQYNSKLCSYIFQDAEQSRDEVCLEKPAFNTATTTTTRPKTSAHPTRFLCSECLKVMPNKQELTKHMISEHPCQYPPGYFLCQICGSKFDSRSELSNHMSTHSQERQHRCFICYAKFQTEALMNRHISSIHSNKK